MSTLDDLIRLIARLCLVAVFLYDGWVIFRDYPGAVRYVEGFHIPGSVLPLVLLLQIGGGIAVALGLWTRLIALPFAAFCFLTAIFFHKNFGRSGEAIEFGKDLGLAGGFLLLYVTGGGRFSIGKSWR